MQRKKQSEQDDPLFKNSLLHFSLLHFSILHFSRHSTANCIHTTASAGELQSGIIVHMFNKGSKLTTSFALVLEFISFRYGDSSRVSTTRYVYSCDMQVLHGPMDTQQQGTQHGVEQSSPRSVS